MERNVIIFEVDNKIVSKHVYVISRKNKEILKL